MKMTETPPKDQENNDKNDVNKSEKNDAKPNEVGGRNGPEPTRYGDWEKNGIISDF